jgi:Ca-activated chloride channel family protein
LAPGAYELRYSTDRADAKGRVYASYPITEVAAAITLTPAPEIHAGSPFDVQVSGPAHDQDYITIVAKGAPDGDYQAYAYVDQTSGTFSLLAPSQPGAYEIRYQNDNDPTQVLARAPVTVGPAIPVTLDAPDSADAGGQIQVRWTGPDGPQDYLTIVPKGAPEGDYGPYTYTADGSPLTLDVPSDPGAYEIRYQSDRTEIGVLGRRPLTVR